LSTIINDINSFVARKRTASDADITAIDVVEYAVKLLEDEPLFNAGKGAVFTADETHELEASIMDGSNLKVQFISHHNIFLFCVFTYASRIKSLASNVNSITPVWRSFNDQDSKESNCSRENCNGEYSSQLSRRRRCRKARREIFVRAR
jgi:hypothetical protein